MKRKFGAKKSSVSVFWKGYTVIMILVGAFVVIVGGTFTFLIFRELIKFFIIGPLF